MSAHTGFTKTSDFLLLTVGACCALLELCVPAPMVAGQLFLVVAGILLIMLAWAIIISAKYQFKKFQQKSGPGNETTTIISTGLFASTRNPIYVGVLLILPAIGLMFNSWWFVLGAAPLFWLIQRLLIVPEEVYLKAKFGDSYRAYCEKVGRWV